MTEHRVLLVIGPDGGVSGPLVSAASVVIADVRGLDIARWRMQRVGWDESAGIEADADERVLAFVRDHGVQAIVVDHVAPALRDTLAAMGVAVFQRAGISARAAAISASTVLNLVHHTREGA